MKKVIVLLAFLLVVIPCQAEIIYVDDDGPADFDNIQDAINYSWHGDTIIVKPGMYGENIYFNSRAITLTSENPDDTNVVDSTIILKSFGYTVTFDFGEGSESVLTGFTIRGRGIHCYASSPTITKNIITDCDNGGIYGELDAMPTISYNTITNNSSYGLRGCHGLIVGNTISYNTRGLNDCDGEIRENEIIGNSGTNTGAGLFVCDGVISNNEIVSNTATGSNASGGGLYECSAIIRHNVISNNSADAGTNQAWGGGLYKCHGEIYNNIILRNRATTGGGLYVCNGTITNNTIVENAVSGYGGGLNSCTGTIKNNIIAFNEASYTGGIWGACDNSFNALWMNEGGNFGGGSIAGPGDICQDPLFADSNNGDYHLKSEAGRWDPNIKSWVLDDVTSPCVDAGDNGDPTGVEPYPNGDIINQGAYGGTWQASKSPSGQTPYCTKDIAEDLNGDCKVGFMDFAITASHWLDVELQPNIGQEWVARYNGPANDDDFAVGLVTDRHGNVYVTGVSDVSSGDFDYATIKYDPNGNELWVARYDGPGNDWDNPSAIAIDNSGNVCVTGYSKGSGTGYAYATIKYDPNGNQLWVARYNGPGNGSDDARAIAVDNSGNVYVTGISTGSGTKRDYATIKYDPNGNELWVARYNGPGGGEDWAEGIAIDNSHNVYVVGWSEGSSTDDDYATIKYDQNGTELWVARYNGPGNDNDHVVSLAEPIAVDNQGNVYVTGRSKGLRTDYDFATIKYDPNGNELWVARYNGPGNGDDSAESITVDKAGNSYVTGYIYVASGDYDYATIKYDPNSNQLWVARYNGPGNGYDFAHSIGTDSAGNVYVTGSSKGVGTDFDYATIIYDPEGNELDVVRYNGPGNYSDEARAMAIDNSENIYVTGWSYGYGTDYDYATIKYSQAYICTTEIKGDINNDCKVDFVDLYTIANHWLDCNLYPPEACWE